MDAENRAPIVDRYARMPQLIEAPALPFGDVGVLLDIPISTLEKLRAQGRGPRCITIGRRLYVRRVDLDVWLDKLADEQGAAA